MRRLLLVGVMLGFVFLGLGVARGSVTAQLPAPANVPAAEAAVCNAASSGNGTAFRSTLIASQDSVVDSSTPALNYGTQEGVAVGNVNVFPSGTAILQTLVAFDLSSLPPDAVIMTATLELYQTYGGSFAIIAQALTGAWTETGVTWNNIPGYTTQNQAAEGAVDGDWRRWDITAIAQQWRTGAAANYGVRLVYDGVLINQSRGFSSREGDYPPRLVVEYALPMTFSAVADTYVRQAAPAANYGSATQLAVQAGTGSNAEQALMRFDLSDLPEGSIVVSASLGLMTHFNMLNAPAAPQAIDLAPEAALAAWGEDTVLWSSAPASQSRGDPAYTWTGAAWNWLDVTQIARAWLSGELSNHGFVLKPAAGTSTAVFYSREQHVTAAPQLIITYRPPPCEPVMNVTIGGATQGVTDMQYIFNASILPSTATLPVLYTWQADEQSTFENQTGVIPYTWATTGTKTITVTASNCESSVVNTHQIVINAPSPACEFPLTGLTLDGPATGFVETEYTYTAMPVPANATTPITYTWQADEQADYTGSLATRNYTWASPGTKQITVTAQNCGGTVVQHYTVNVQPRPDLTISGAWYNLAEQRIYYILKNVGGGTSPAGFTVELSRDGSPVASDVFDAAVPPGAARSGNLPYAWTCAGATAEMQVCADATGVIPEDDEGNNCFQQTWSCDLTPPQIISGPTVSGISETGATISWTTDEPCRSTFEYAPNGPFGAIQTRTDNTPKTNHQVTLTGLNSGSLYWYKANVTDAAGNFNSSGGRFFETEPVGTDPVVLGTFGIENYRDPATEEFEFFTLYANVTSNPAGVDHVAFFFMDQLIGRDHSPDGSRYEIYVSPAALGMTRAEWYDQSRLLWVKAYNLVGTETADVDLVRANPPRPAQGRAAIVTPGAGHQVLIDGTTAPAGTTLQTRVYAVEYLWKCASEAYNPANVPPGLEYVDCGDTRQKAQRVRLYLGTTLVEDYVPADGEFSRELTVDLAGKPVGTYTLMTIVTLSDGTNLYAERPFTVKQGLAQLTFERSAERRSHYFLVTVKLGNAGSATGYLDYLDDYARGFQVVEMDTPGYTITGLDWGDAPERRFRIDFRNGGSPEYALAPGAEITVQYMLIPILDMQNNYSPNLAYYIGSGDHPNAYAALNWRLTGNPLQQLFHVGANWIDGAPLNEAVRQAVASANYILITSPGGLRHFVDHSGVNAQQRQLNQVLSNMAGLAGWRGGVIGFLPVSPCASKVDKLLEPGGAWAEALHPDFKKHRANGYVLFVGEHEIIPAQGAGYGVGYSDLRYASTSGQAKPELALGRIVGNHLWVLARGLDTALRFHRDNVGLDRSHALGLSGTDDKSAREREVFWGDIQAAGNTFANRGNFAVTRLRGKDTNWETYKDAVATSHPDVFFYSGHGSPGGWHLLNSGNLWELDFGVTSPIALAFACSTGDYKAGNNTMPEAWLRHGGAVYVGATSKSYDYPDSDAVRAFANYWPLSTQERNIGQVFTYIKRDKWAHDYEWKMFAYQYHLYGDPTYGAIMPTSVQQRLTLTALQAATTLDVTVPDFEITPTEDGLDAVEIPGGAIWFRQEGDYRIPYWIVSQDYPPGQRVQALTLTLQSGLEITTGLHIPTMTLDIRCPGCAPALAPQSEAEWVPDVAQPYAWQVVDNPDGTSTLELRIYPFFYNPATTDARFYKEWSFDVDVFSSTVDIVSLRPAQLAFGLAENVTATLLVNNSGAEQMFVAQTVVKSLSEEVETTLPLRALRAITGTALIDLVITETLAAGDYVLEVTLLDMEGRVLDTEMTEFTAGIVAGEVTNLTATPSLFQPGDNVALALTFENTGDVPLNGVAVLRVEGDTVTETVEFTHTLSALSPGAVATFDNVWDSIGATGETYRVVGYVAHDFGAFAPREVILSTRAYIYLPLVLKSGN